MKKNQKKLWKIASLWEQHDTFSKKSSSYTIPYDDYPHATSRYYDRFFYVDEIDTTTSSKIIFSDDNGEYYGLARCQIFEVGNKVVYLFDNHNEIIFPLAEYYETTSCESINILHIDAHPDDAQFLTENKPKTLSRILSKEIISQTRVSDFFDALSESMVINKIKRVVTSYDFHNFVPPDYPYILSLDIDIFGPEGEYIDLETKVSVIAQAWKHANVVMIATSPGFIDQQYAHDILLQMIKQ